MNLLRFFIDTPTEDCEKLTTKGINPDSGRVEIGNLSGNVAPNEVRYCN